jgi:hypothetical protein
MALRPYDGREANTDRRRRGIDRHSPQAGRRTRNRGGKTVANVEIRPGVFCRNGQIRPLVGGPVDMGIGGLV